VDGARNGGAALRNGAQEPDTVFGAVGIQAGSRLIQENERWFGDQFHAHLWVK